jgi:hypothetical protein
VRPVNKAANNAKNGPLAVSTIAFPHPFFWHLWIQWIEQANWDQVAARENLSLSKLVGYLYPGGNSEGGSDPEGLLVFELLPLFPDLIIPARA